MHTEIVARSFLTTAITHGNWFKYRYFATQQLLLRNRFLHSKLSAPSFWIAMLSSASSPSPVHSDATCPVPGEKMHPEQEYQRVDNSSPKRLNIHGILLIWPPQSVHFFSDVGIMTSRRIEKCASKSHMTPTWEKRDGDGTQKVNPLLKDIRLQKLGSHLVCGQSKHDQIRIGSIEAVPLPENKTSA